MPKNTKRKQIKAPKTNNPPLVRYELWVSLDRAVIAFHYPPEGQKPHDYDDHPEDFIQTAPQCWAELGGKSRFSGGKIHAYQFDRNESAAFIRGHIPGAYVERVEVAQ